MYEYTHRYTVYAGLPKTGASQTHWGVLGRRVWESGLVYSILGKCLWSIRLLVGLYENIGFGSTLWECRNYGRKVLEIGFSEENLETKDLGVGF